MASSEPILCPSASTTSWPRHSRMFSASNMPVRLLTEPRRRLCTVLPEWEPQTLAGKAGPRRMARSSRALILRRWRYRSAAAPILTTGPGQQLLIDEIPPQHRVVGVDGPQELADAVLRVAHPGLEALCDLVKQQAAPRPLGGHDLDLAFPDEHPQPLVGSDRLDDGCRIKIGHDHILSTRPRPARASDQPLSWSG